MAQRLRARKERESDDTPVITQKIDHPRRRLIEEMTRKRIAAQVKEAPYLAARPEELPIPAIHTEPSADDLAARDEMLKDSRVRRVGAGMFKANLGLMMGQHSDGSIGIVATDQDGLLTEVSRGAPVKGAEDSPGTPALDEGVVIDHEPSTED